MLDEVALRKRTFQEGPKVKLGDGQEWTFPPPYLRLYPVRDAEGKTSVGGGMSYGADFEDKLDSLLEAEETYDRLAIQFALAADLLTANYELDRKALRRLLPIEMREGADNSIWSDINAVLTGQSAPKPSSDGSDSPSSPTASETL